MTFQVDYLSGLSSFKNPTLLSLKVDTKGKMLYFYTSSTVQKLAFDKLLDISFDEKFKRSAGKAAAGAIVGGLLTGGVGAIVGAGIGARRNADSRLYITYSIGQLDQKVILKGKNLTEIQATILQAIEASQSQQQFVENTEESNYQHNQLNDKNHESQVLENIKQKQDAAQEGALFVYVIGLVIIIALWMSCGD